MPPVPRPAYAKRCAIIYRDLLAQDWEPSNPRFNDEMCRRLRLFGGRTQLIRNLLGQTLEVSFGTQEEVPKRWRPAQEEAGEE